MRTRPTARILHGITMLLSVIIPVRNAEGPLLKTLDSLKAADPLAEWLEIIVQDGGEIETSPTDQRIKRYRETDSGIYDAMNKGRSKATGRWLMFAGAGDEWIGGSDIRAKLENAFAPLQVFAVELKPPLEPGVRRHYPARWDASMIWRNSVHHQGVCYRADVLPSRPFETEYKVLSDYALHLRFFRNDMKAEVHKTPMMQVASGGISRQFTWQLYQEELRLKRQVLGPVRGAIQWPWICAKWLYKRIAQSHHR